ncbi:PREDICTED: coiled-coil domain-containing protein 9 [Nanorana parkeri]|uniref:coiled-coil domain-containing protein 9 n=1 Tax=Nanorana parkeri TaxID=125878 RepID=UPI000854B4EB|nr:PREDICTED: coiled-coil domain-containing protein 9 [Nanorana parkeri]
MASVVDLKSKEEKDAELDRKIEALRKKNEALMKRHKLIEEDRKMAEQEGNAVTTPRKIKMSDGEPDKARKEKENFSITLDVSPGEKRIVSEGKAPRDSHTPTRTKTSPRSPTQRASVRTGAYPGGRSPQFDRSGETFKFDDDNIHPSERMERGRRRQGAEAPNRGPRVAKEGPSVEQWTPSSRGGRGPSRGRGGDTPGRGGGLIVNTEGTSGTDRKVKEWEEKRKLNIEKMNEEMEQIAEYERHRRDGMREKNPIRNFLDDPRRTGPIAEVDRKEGSRRHTRNWGGTDFEKVKTGMDRESHVRRSGGRNQMDMTLSMTGRERAEYVRWKQEREQIDQERLARHRKPTGQWKREWDAEKTDTMFKDGSTPHIEDEPMGRRELDKRGPPKPTTMAEFIPRSLQSSGEKRDQKRGRGKNKPYSMHDSRWEDDDEEEVNEKDQMLPVEEKEKETCVEETEETKVEGAQKNTSKAPKPVVDEKKDEFKHDKEECEEGEEDEEEWTDASGDDDDDDDEEEEDDGSEVEEDSIEEASKASPATPKEQRLPQQRETPKLIMPPPNVNSEEGAVESKPTSPFSPDGHHPVTDWGEEMELLSPPGSSNEDSPPQVVNRKVFTMDSRSHSGQ